MYESNSILNYFIIQKAYLYALPAESYFLYLKTDGNTGMVEDMENEASKKK